MAFKMPTLFGAKPNTPADSVSMLKSAVKSIPSAIVVPRLFVRPSTYSVTGFGNTPRIGFVATSPATKAGSGLRTMMPVPANWLSRFRIVRSERYEVICFS